MILMPSEGEREGKFSTKGGGRTRNSSKREEGFFFTQSSNLLCGSRNLAAQSHLRIQTLTDTK